jgi:hypothetical protein
MTPEGPIMARSKAKTDRGPNRKPRQTTVVNYRADNDEFAEAFDTLRAKVGAKDGPTLIDAALALLAARHGVAMPRRALPRGTNRFTRPKET